MASTQIKQCFYIISGEQNSKELYDDMNTLIDMGIPFFLVVNPNYNIHRNIISVIANLQQEQGIQLLLMDDGKLGDSYFAIKGFDKRLAIAGRYKVDNNKVIYKGEDTIEFELIQVNQDPLDTLDNINTRKNVGNNLALVMQSDEFDISTLLLAYNEFGGLPLDVQNYSLKNEDPILVYDIFANIGDLTLIFFTVSIIIFLATFVIFKKWSKEKFLS